MGNKGLTKLMEESGEVIQIASKQIELMNTDFHSAGAESTKEEFSFDTKKLNSL